MRYGLASAVSQLLPVVGLAVAMGVQVPAATAWEFGAGTNAAVTPVSSSPSSTAAQKRTASTAERTAVSYSPTKRYFVEFRARNAASYGHMYVMYGEVNERHEVIRSEIAGLFPAGDTRDCENCSRLNWTIGHVLPVPSEIGASDGDLEEQYVLARFRVWIDAKQYKRLVAYIKERKAHKGPWNALLNNCVIFGRDVAVFSNLKIPLLASIAPTVVMYPKEFVEALAEANGVYKDQGPLKDAPGSLPVEVAHKAQPAAEKTPAEKAVTEAAPAASKKRLASQRDEVNIELSRVH